MSELDEIAEVYRGYIVRRYTVGRYVDVYNYRCGKFRAPRKKDVIAHIELLLEKKLSVDSEINLLEKQE